MISRLCLGTAQFGLEYGIANKRGVIPKKEVFEILQFAQESGVVALDTSIAYGISEEVIGEFIAETRTSFEIISKILRISESEDSYTLRLKLEESLKKLKVRELYGCLIHKFEDFLKYAEIWDVLKLAQKQGLIQKIGFSLYRPEELDLLWQKDIVFDIIQIPYSIFDRRFEKYFDVLKQKKIEIHVRSIFLQGLFFLNVDMLPPVLKVAKPQLELLKRIVQKHHIEMEAICLNFALLNPQLDKILIGVNGPMEFRKNIMSIDLMDQVKDIYAELREIKVEQEEILLPYKWVTQN